MDPKNEQIDSFKGGMDVMVWMAWYSADGIVSYDIVWYGRYFVDGKAG